MTITDISLDDVYNVSDGRIYLTGVQALVRLPIEQRRRDRAAGLKTGGFISGYRGSPLGGYDRALWGAKTLLDEHDIRFHPGLNEELAATAVLGTQQASVYPDFEYDGVFAIWYGKGPGLDRAGDALKHCNSYGSSRHGGALVVVGDDHGAVSSSLAHQCEQVMQSWMMPVFNPASLLEYLDLGLLGFALSRFSGCFVGFKAVSETVESAASIRVSPELPKIVLPEDFEMPPDGLHIRWPDPQLAQEERLQYHRLPAAKAFARANRLDRCVLGPERGRLGIISTGKSHLDLMQALWDLGIDDKEAHGLGLGIYKVVMSYPLESESATAFAAGFDEVLVVEEKRPFVETQLKEALYNLAAERRPRVSGKTDPEGRPLLPSNAELDADLLARAVVARLGDAELERRAAAKLQSYQQLRGLSQSPSDTVRTPFFCSGCPHNTSTRIPEGSRALAGTGCHLMAALMDRETSSFLHMGAEGCNWIGHSPYVTAPHIFQNLGDGTYNHSGSLAIRQALAAGVNITYKILYNDAVAMTGGQPFEGGLTVPQITQQVYHEGVRRIAVVSDDADKYPSDVGFAPGTSVHQRDELEALQHEMRELPGVSVIVYDQVCATELRRRRKRGQAAQATRRVFINSAVCEGCGDCSVQSNCISVVPLETPLGRKRAIDQSTCNSDLSCLEGFCPALVTLEGAEPRRLAAAAASADFAATLPPPPRPQITKPYGVLVTGIGGTGVITTGQIIGMAAHIDGRGVSVMDFTGLAQRGGGVVTHVRLAPKPDDIYGARVPFGGAGLLLGGDLVVSTGPEVRSRLSTASRAVVDSGVAMTAAMVIDPRAEIDDSLLRHQIEEAVGRDNLDALPATRLAERLSGNSVAANMVLLGHALQSGALPLSLAAVERAIELNGVSIEDNKRCLALGRLAAHDRAAALALVGLSDEAPKSETLEDSVARRSAFLSEYQNVALAERFRAMLARVEAVEASLGSERHLSAAVAESYFKLLAVKDEWEVARLYAEGDFQDQLKARFSGDYRLRFHLSPPWLAPRDRYSGARRKTSFGPWALTLFGLLARLRGLRGGPLDVFAWQSERRRERQLVSEFEATLEELLAGLGAANLAQAVDIARLPLDIKGFGPVKERAITRFEIEHESLMAAYRHGDRAAAAE